MRIHLPNNRGESPSDAGAAAWKKAGFRWRTFEASRVPMVVMDVATWALADCNTAATEILGFASREETLGKTLLDVSAPTQYDGIPSSEKARHFVGEALAQGNIVFEWRHRRPDGELWDAEVHLMSLPSGEGQFLQLTLQDITQRKRMENDLADSRANLEALIESTADLIWSVDAEYRLVTYNRAMSEHLKRNRNIEIACGMASHLLFPDALKQTWADYFDRARNEGAFRQEYALLDGRTLSLSFNPIRREGRFVGVSVFGKDITQRKQAEEALRLKNLLLSSQQEASIDGILIVDENARILLHNRRFVEMWQVPEEMMLGLKDEPLLRWVAAQMANPEAFLRRVHDLYKHRDEVGRDELNLANGRVVERYSAPVRSAEGGYFGRAWYFRDITERRQLEAQLRQAQKLEAVGQLAGGVAHDFNNILAALLMHLGLLQENPALDEETRRSLNDMEGEARRAVALTRQLLMFSRRSVLEVKPLDLNELVENLLKMLRRLIGEQNDLRFDAKTGLPGVEADAGMLEQVVMNLVVNARDAMPKGGRITLGTSVAEWRDDEAAQAPVRRPGRFVCLVVADTGTGMNEATLKRIFEPFFTTKDPGKGTGLGLATVHGIVAQHKGWVEVVSELGKGTTFTIFLPALAHPVLEVASPVSVEPLRRGRETLLLVEDSANARQTIGQALRVLGYRVYEAANGQEALSVWQTHGAQVDLLLTDMVMPEGMTGLELAERLQALRPDLKVILSSGYSAEIVRAGVASRKRIVYLPKPYTVKKLAEVVRNCLDSKP